MGGREKRGRERGREGNRGGGCPLIGESGSASAPSPLPLGKSVPSFHLKDVVTPGRTTIL